MAFGEFARWRRSALADLPAHVGDFVAMRAAAYGRGRAAATEVRGPVEQMLTVILPGFERTGRTRRELPFARAVPGFFEYLADERGLRPESIVSYRHHLAGFEAYLEQIGITGLQDLSPAILSAFVAERAGAGLARTTVRTICGVLRVFLRYARRHGLLAADLSKAVEWPTAYQLSGIPRSISWEQVGLVLGAVDRRTPRGKRDYAILLLLVTYGLGPRGGGAEAGRYRLEARPAGHPRPQGRAFDRVPASAVAARPWWTTCGTAAPVGHCSCGLWPRGPGQQGRGLRVRPALLAQGRIQVPGRGRTRCGIPASSGWWTPVSGSRRSGTSSGTARGPHRRYSQPSGIASGGRVCAGRLMSGGYVIAACRWRPVPPDLAGCTTDPVWCMILPSNG